MLLLGRRIGREGGSRVGNGMEARGLIKWVWNAVDILWPCWDILLDVEVSIQQIDIRRQLHSESV